MSMAAPGTLDPEVDRREDGFTPTYTQQYSAMISSAKQAGEKRCQEDFLVAKNALFATRKSS